MKKQKGLTLIELMVTIGVAITLLALGVPAYDTMMANNRAVSSTNRLVGALKLARSEAINRGVAVSVCSRNAVGSLVCGSSSDWTNGLLLFTDGKSGATGAGVYASGSEELLSELGQPPGNPVVTSAAAFFRFLASGERDENNGGSSIIMEFPNCSGKQKRTINISNTGYVSVVRVSCT